MSATIDNMICSQIFDNATTVGIGVGTGVTTSGAFPVLPRVHMLGELYIASPFSGAGLHGGDIWMTEYQFGGPFRAFSMYGSLSTGVIAIGNRSGNSATTIASSTVSGSIFIGNSAGGSIGTSNVDYNTFIGNGCGDLFTGGSSTDDYNVLLGADCGQSLVTGGSNIILGSAAAPACTTGTGNTIVGYHSGGGIIEGNNNVFIGDDTYINTTSYEGSDNVIIGSNAYGQILEALMQIIKWFLGQIQM